MERGKFPSRGTARIYDDGRECTRARYARKKEREENKVAGERARIKSRVQRG